MEFVKYFTKHVAVRFIIAGGTAAAIDIVLLYVLNNVFGMQYLLSAILAFIGAFGVSFTLHKFWTFKSHTERSDKQAMRYMGTSLFGLGLNTILMYAFVSYLNILVIPAQFIAGGLVAFSSFFISHKFVFRYKNR